MGRILTDSEVEALPEEIRGWYRTNEGLRTVDDLVYFPAAKRASLERLAAKGEARTIERIRQAEGDEAADAAARELTAARSERARLVASQERQAS